MIHDLLMPKLGLTMVEGLVAEWKVTPGQVFAQGEVLLVVETEKVANEIEAEGPGVMTEILVPQGGTAAVGSVIARWRDAPAESGVPGSSLPLPAPLGKEARATSQPPAPSGTRISSTPLARRFARRHGIDLAKVRGTGPSGRVTMADVEAAAGASQASPPVESPGKGETIPFVGSETRTPAGSIQATMARRLTAVKQEVPHFYLASEAEATALLDFRKSWNEDPGNPRITINHLVVAAVGRALLDLPGANRVWDAGQVVTFSGTDVGIAVHTPRGLFVPIVRDAGRRGLYEVVEQSERLIGKTREGRLEGNDTAGGAMAVSNAGMFQVSYLTPIINPGHSAILGVGSIRQLFRPDEGGHPSLRREIGLVLACDHRVFDGVAGLELLNKIIAYLENPLRLLRKPVSKE